MSEVLDPRRLWLLIRSDLIADYRSDFVFQLVCGTLAAVMLLVSMWTVAQGNESPDHYLIWFYVGIFVWAPIVASFSFKELHDKTRNEAYLLLPASALEKTIARLIGTTVVFFVFLLIFMTVASALIEGINLLVFGRRNGLFDASHEGVWAPVGHFLVVVSSYFLGAAWFRRFHYIKTALTFTALPIALMCVAVIVLRLVLGSWQGFNISQADASNFYFAHEGLFDALLGALKILYFVGFPLFCWYVAWLRVKETEVSHGV